MSENRPARIDPMWYVVAAVVLWSTGGLFIKSTSFDVYAVNFGRGILAAAVVGIFTYKRGLRPDPFTIFISFLYAGTLMAYVFATKNTTAANAIFLQYTAPVYILVLSPLILKEHFHIRDLVTVVLCIFGMSFFFLETGDIQVSAPNIFIGNIAALISGVFFGLYFIYLRHPKARRDNPAISVFYGNLIVCACMLPFLIAEPPVPDSAWDVSAIIYLGVFQIGVAYMFFTHGLANGVRAMDASIIGFVEPLLNPVWVYLFIGERPGKWAVIGGCIILGAVIFHTLRQYRIRPKNEAAEQAGPGDQ